MKPMKFQGSGSKGEGRERSRPSCLTGMLMLFPNNQDEAFHRNRIFRGLFERLGTMPVFVDLSVVCTVVIVQSWLVENDGDGFTTLHIVCPANTIDANLARIEPCWHVRYERHEMWIRIQVVKRNGADISNSHDLGREVIMTSRNMVARPGWAIPDEALYPHHTVHRQRVIWRTLVGCDTRGASIPPGHRVVELVIEPTLRKGKRLAHALW